MLAISVRLLHGTIRATGPADTTITGAGDAGEWPPSPARLFSALVAGDGTGSRRWLTDGSELRLLERAAPPRIVADGLDVVLQSPLCDRFVVVDQLHRGAVQEYVGRTAALVRPGSRLAPVTPVVTYVWDDVDADRVARNALALRAARVGYLGCSDSPARLSVSTEPVADDEAWVPSDDGPVALPVPYDGFLDALDALFERSQQGEAVRRAWVPNRYVRYRPPGARQQAPSPPNVLWLRFEPSVSGRRLLAVTESLRAAVLERYDADVTSDAVPVPSVLHGHGIEGRGYHHAYFLALPDVGHRHARGRLHGAAVVLPPETPADVVEGVRTALWRVLRLVKPGVFETRLRPHGGETRPTAAAPSRWMGPSRRWVSATPVVHERFHQGGPTLVDVQGWCEHAAVAARPVWFRSCQPPIAEGALSLHPSEVHRKGRARRPYSHLEVLFEHPVQGPLVLGAGRQFGFGLMLPLKRRDGADG
jgi:CRISPR-associated protein Csb2